jgi:glycosyltransferase involved in cell wall biosynthesis
MELAAMGHHVDVMTRANNRLVIEAALEAAPVPGLNFHYYDLPDWAKWWKHGLRGIHLYYELWQRGVYRVACRLVRQNHYDVIHYLTFTEFRQPCHLWRIGLPFVMGPVGGGEMVPPKLFATFPTVTPRLHESIRLVLTRLSKLRPSVRKMFRNADIVFYKTDETLQAFPKFARDKARLHSEIGVDAERLPPAPTGPPPHPSFLYVGRTTFRKGLHLALESMARLRSMLPDATLTVIGRGPELPRLKRMAARLGLKGAVTWKGWMPQNEIWDQYRQHTAFLFPSLHDSGGTVVLESMSQGLPVICLDAGGPGKFVRSGGGGIPVPVMGRKPAQVKEDLAAAMHRIHCDSMLRAELAEKALAMARRMTWRAVVERAYEQIEQIAGAQQGEISARERLLHS